MSESSKIEERKDKLKSWLKNKENIFLLLLISFAIIYRLYYFLKLGQQPIWWDEGDYLAVSKVWATGMSTPEWWGHFTGMRPLLLPLVWTLFFKLGLGELGVRFFTLLLPSILAIYFVYAVGREIYDKRIGLIAAFMLSVYWTFTFYTYRLLTDIPATLFGLISIYFFYKGYIKENKQSGLYLCFLFGILAFSTRFPLALILMTCMIFLLFIKKLSLFKEKSFWKGVLVFLLIASPFIVYVALNKFYFIWFYFINGLGGLIATGQPFGFYIFGLSISLLEVTWAIAFFLGSLTFYKLFVGFDIFWKQEDKSINSDFFIALWIILQFIFYVFVFRSANDRWIIMLTIPMFFVASKGISYIYDIAKKYSAIISAVILIAFLAIGAYQHIQHASLLIEQKKESYREIQLAGEWLKENSPEDAKIITASIVQNQYYSERDSYDFYTNDSIWKSCIDFYGNLNTNESCQQETEKAFIENKLNRINPNYMIVSIFEPVFTPQWAYSYPERHNMTAVQAYFDNKNQPLLVIYKF